MSDNRPARLPTLLERIVRVVSSRPARVATLLVEGDAGSGVTTLLAEAARLGADEYPLILRGSVTDDTQLGLLLDAFGGANVSEDLRVALDPHAPSEACFRARLVRHMVTWFGEAGVLMVLDNVHLADPESTATLSLLLRDPDVRGLTIVLGARSGQLPAELRAACLTSDLFDTVRVPTWDVATVRGEFPELSAVRARVLCEATEGRPAFVTALCAMPTTELRQLDRLPVAVVADRIATGARGFWPGPGGLAQPTRLVAASAALLGRDVDVERVAAVSELSVDRVVAALTELTKADLLREDAGQLRFVHPAVRAAAYRWVSAPERVLLHRRAVGVLSSEGASALDVADHLAIAARLGDLEAARALVAAAWRRLATDPAAAGRWAVAAIRCLGDLDETDDTLRDEATYLLARAHADAGRATEAVEVANALLADGPFRGRAAVLVARCERLLGRHAVARSMLLRELPAAAEDAALGREVALELAAQAVDLPPRPGVADPQVVTGTSGPASDPAHGAAHAVLALGNAVRHPRPGRDRQALLAQADVAADLVDRLSNRDLTAVVDHLPVLVWCETRLDLLDRAAVHAERASSAARGRHHTLARLLVVRAHLELLRGHLDVALEHAAEAAEIGRELGMPAVVRLADAVALPARLWAGAPVDADVDDGARPTVRLDAVDRFVMLARADVLHQLGQHAAAKESVLAVLGSLCATTLGGDELDLADLDRLTTDDAAAVLALAVTVQVAAGDLASARSLWPVAQQLAARGCEYDAATVDLAGSVLACAEGRLTEGRRLALQAARRFERMGAPLAAGRARMQASDAYRMAEDANGAHREIGAAKRVFRLHRAEFLVAAAAIAQKRLAASQSGSLRAGSFGLSAREVEIAQLVCQGLTNRAIAERLFLSVRTVDSHVARILSKVGVTSRLALVAMFPAQQTLTVAR